DRDQVAVVLRNLLSNALKFSFEQGNVQVFAESSDKGISVFIKDEGTGMAEEVRDRLFEKQQTPAYGTNGERGSGLGLLLCQEFVIKNDGEIRVDSSPGNGTCFRLGFPGHVLQVKPHASHYTCPAVIANS